MKKLLIVSLLCLSLTACNSGTVSQITTDQSSWVTLNADLLDGGDFSVLTPSAWTFKQDVGTDSQVGTISGDGITLQFAYGLNTGNPIDETESGEKLKSQNEVIDGRPAVILTPKVTGDGEVAVYFESTQFGYSEDQGTHLLDGDHFLLFGENLTAEQEATALQIFRSIQFKQ